MKLEVTQKNARANGKPIDKGTILEIKGDTIPASLVGKVAIINPAAAKAEKQDDAPAKTPAEVLAMAETAHFMTFKAEAAKLLGDKTPGSKADIVAALEELATQP